MLIRHSKLFDTMLKEVNIFHTQHGYFPSIFSNDKSEQVLAEWWCSIFSNTRR